MTRSLRYFRPEVPQTGMVYKKGSTPRPRDPPARQSLAPDRVTAVNTTLFNVEVAISWPGRAAERAVVLRILRLGAAGERRMKPDSANLY
jgi:hypothetical protein